MRTRTRLSLTMRTGLGLAALLLAGSVSVGAEETRVLEEVHVTGTRIVKANMVSASPITQIDSEDLLLSGLTRVEDLLKNLPQVYSAQNGSTQLTATGTATINLRYLGAQRTLVLIDGRRLPSGSPYTAGAADINQIPGALISRVEVLTGGASATYGSDAVAGVVNFFLVDDFEGVKLDYQFSQYSHDNNNGMMEALLDEAGHAAPSGTSRDGDTSDVALIIGRNLADGRGNVTAYATYRDIDPVAQADRIYSACKVDGPPAPYSCGGSYVTPQGDFGDFGLLSAQQGVPGFSYKVEGNEFVDFGDTLYNYNALTYFQRPDERWTAGVLGHYQVNEHVEVYSQLMYTDDRTISQVAPSGAFYGTDTLSCGNPFLSAQQFDAVCGDYGLGPEDEQLMFIGRRNVEGEPRRNDLRHDSYRMLFGMRGDINQVWRYDLYAQYAEVDMKASVNDFLNSRIARALDATTHPDTGEPVCVSVLDGSDPNCVPWNIFEEGAVSPEAVEYLSVPVSSRGTTDQTVFSGYVAANLDSYGIRSPFADTGVDLVLGLEYREENLEFKPGAHLVSGDVAGQLDAILPIKDGFDVTEIYTELSLPLVEGKPWADSLTLDLGYRYSDYSTDQDTDTYKVAASWSPVEELRLRASFQHAVRVPNIEELFDPQQGSSFGIPPSVGDPCAGMSPARSLTDCLATGVTVEQYGSIPVSEAGSYNSLIGGNTALAPEESDTRSIGFLYWPSFIEGLSISADWYEIEIDDAINNAVSPQSTLFNCLDSADPFFCDKIHRNPVRGDLWIGDIDDGAGFINVVNDNISHFSTTGYDVVLDYSFDIGSAGSMTVHNIFTYVDKWGREEVSGEPALECQGAWSFFCNASIPEIRNNLRLTWLTPWNLTISGLWRHIDGVDAQNTNFAEDLDEVDYLDLAALWTINDNLTLRAGINNVFDEEPPLATGFIQGRDGNTLPNLYDSLGQYWFAGVSVSF